MDPIRPFATLIRSLRLSRKSQASGVREEGASTPSSGRSEIGLDAMAPARGLQAALQTRLRSIDTWDEQHVRALFVEHILLAEIGPDLAKDPGFADVVAKVSAQLGEDPAISARLNELLRDLGGRK